MANTQIHRLDFFFFLEKMLHASHENNETIQTVNIMKKASKSVSIGRKKRILIRKQDLMKFTKIHILDCASKCLTVFQPC